MTEVVRKKNTYLYWPYAILLFLIPIGFYLVSLKEDISAPQHITYILIILWLATAGVFGVTSRVSRLSVYGWLYVSCSVVFAYMGLVFIW